MADGLEKNVSPPEVVVMGRLSADIYPTELRTSLRHQRSFIRYVGGFAGNVSTGLARLQVSTAIVSKVGDDGHGEFIRDFLSGEGVDVGWLGVDHTLNTPVVFCEIWPPDRFPLLFYRTPTCPDWELTPDGGTGKNSYIAEFHNSDGTFKAVGPDGRGIPPGKYQVCVEHLHNRADKFRGALNNDATPFVFLVGLIGPPGWLMIVRVRGKPSASGRPPRQSGRSRGALPPRTPR